MPTKVLNRYSLALASVVAAGVVLHLVSLPAGDPGFIRDFFNMGHVLGFAVLAWLLVRWLELALGAPAPAARTYVAAATIAAGFAVTAEGVQVATPRDADLGDIVNDALGTTAGLLVAYAGAAAPRRRLTALCAAALVVLAGIAAPTSSLLARTLVHARFPELADFETRLDMRLVGGRSADVARVDAPARWPHDGHVARIATRGHARYEGAAFDRWPRDWTGYETLAFTISAEPAAAVTVRVHDTEHDNRYDDRFNRTFEIGPEPETLRIALADVRSAPRGRALDLSRVAGVVIFMTNRERRVLHLDRLRLE